MKTTAWCANFFGRAGLVLCVFVLAVVGSASAFDDPPIRVARLNYVQGEVSFQPGGESDWGWATVNRPMTAGDSLWTSDRSRAEMHIGSTAIRVDGQTSVSFLNLDDRTVQIQLNSGTINVRVRNLYRDEVFEVDTPNLAFTLLQRGDYRITVDPDGRFTTITLRDGQGQINGGGQAFLVDGGSQVQVSGTDNISYDIYDLPGRDSFDQWSYNRELIEGRSQSARYVSPELTGYEDLDRNGTWRTDATYGPVWVPTHVSRDWAPYREGHWAWVDPWGWTWVDDAPSGFVTSHYGRWAHVNEGNGGGDWAWVPPHHEANEDESHRPVYSPALVIFVGNSNSSRDFGNGGGVAWVPLAPGEVYVPAYQTSPKYVTNVNITNTVVQQTTIINVVNNNGPTTTHANQRVEGAVTAVPRATFVNAQPVAKTAVRVAPSAITAAPAVQTAPVAPVKASVMGANKESAAAAGQTSAPKPPAAVASRPVVAKVAPPPAPVAFAQKQQALQANPGKPLDTKAEQALRAATPPPVVHVVKTAPPVQAVKPVETTAKKPQPAASPNTAQEVHPPAPAAGTPPAAAGSQQSAQQQAAEKAKQQATQQQAAQQTAAEKDKQQSAQQQAAADKAKQDAAQQQANQQAAVEKSKQQAAQQQAAADKAKQEAAQQQAAQQAAVEKNKQQAAQQQAAADKAKQEAVRQQAAQQQAAQAGQGNRPAPTPIVHPNELPVPPPHVVQPSANAELDRKHQQEQDQLHAKQEQDRQRVQQQQDQEHARLAQQPADGAKKQQVEQQHQEQTQQLQQKHAEEQKLLEEKQKLDQSKPQKGGVPPGQKL
ncbi:MAG TPA: DUF6600 domain-containing protein [Candidatus Angelobacter sp.]|nr:DUF6600 domain-containing protein [Candidatus Angelobacter sp.]